MSTDDNLKLPKEIEAYCKDEDKDRELKPCPFCGGEAIEFGGGVMSGIKCLRCGITKLNREIWNTRFFKEVSVRTFASKDSKLNMCDCCFNEFPNCNPTVCEFGNGIGNDNVVACSEFIEKYKHKDIEIDTRGVE